MTTLSASLPASFANPQVIAARVGPIPGALLRFWWHTARIPLSCFVPVAILLATTDLDLYFAHGLFFDSGTGHWLGASNWWVASFIHVWGRWVVRLVVLVALAMWSLSYAKPGCVHWRRPAGYFTLAVVLTVGVVGLLKLITDVDCPWDLAAFNGSMPYVHLFEPRPHGLPRAACFPAAHASSGYALMALYFVFLSRSRRLARIGLVAGICLGLVFGLAQQSRGAHLLSHDIWSAMLAWLIPLSVYVWGFKCRLWSAADRDDAGMTMT